MSWLRRLFGPNKYQRYLAAWKEQYMKQLQEDVAGKWREQHPSAEDIMRLDFTSKPLRDADATANRAAYALFECRGPRILSYWGNDVSSFGSFALESNGLYRNFGYDYSGSEGKVK